MTGSIPSRRIVVVNLDRTWNFVALVRRGALDTFADRDETIEIHFRTLGHDGSLNADGRLKVWGAERPLSYGEDIDSLTDDLIEDVDDLVATRIADLAFVVVLPDPDTPGTSGDATARPRFLERLEDEIHLRESMLERPPRRWICVRDVTGSRSSPGFDRLIDALTTDATLSARQLSDRVFRLRAPRVGDPDLEIDKRHFLALRVVAAVARDTFAAVATAGRTTDTADDKSTRSSPIGELLRNETVFEILLPGTPVPTTSAAVALLLEGQRRAAAAATPGHRVQIEGDDATTRRVREVLATIETSLTVPGQETSPASADRAALDEETTALAELVSSWWTAEGEKAVTTHGEAVLATMRTYVERRVDQFAAYRTDLESRIATEVDAQIRTAIRAIPIVGGGLTGASAAQLDRILREVRGVREAAESRAETARAAFMGALLPLDRTRARRDDALAPKLALDRIDAYGEAVAAHAALRTLYRRLVPRAYWWALSALTLAALVTVVAHAYGKSVAHATTFWAALGDHSLAVGAAVFITSLVSLVGFTVSAKGRRRDMKAAIDGIRERHAGLWSRVTALTDAAFHYVAISRHLLYYRLLEEELERRRRDEDASALAIAFEDIAHHGEVPPVVPPERAAAHSQEMTAALATLPPVRWIRRMLELPSTFATACPGPKPMRFVVTPGTGSATAAIGASGTFQAAATVFQREQTIEISVVPIPRDPIRDGGTGAQEGAS